MRKLDTAIPRGIRFIAFVTLTMLAACDSSRSERRTDSTIGKAGPGNPSAARVKAAPHAPSIEGEVSQVAMAPLANTLGRAMAAGASNASIEAPSPGPSVEASDAVSLSNAVPLTASDPTGAMLVRRGDAIVEVRRLDDAVTRVRQSAAQLGGFVANASLRGGREERRTAQMELRVPTTQFDQLVSSLSAIGRVESVASQVEDVADEYVDLRARASNARRTEARLVELLNRRTAKLSDVLTVEQELARVRSEIERYDARLNWLEKRTSLSTLALSLHEPIPLIERQPGPGPIVEAFARAWQNAVGVIAWCIASLGVLLPVGAVILGIAMLVRWVLRGRPQGGVAGA